MNTDVVATAILYYRLLVLVWTVLDSVVMVVFCWFLGLPCLISKLPFHHYKQTQDVKNPVFEKERDKQRRTKVREHFEICRLDSGNERVLLPSQRDIGFILHIHRTTMITWYDRSLRTRETVHFAGESKSFFYDSKSRRKPILMPERTPTSKRRKKVCIILTSLRTNTSCESTPTRVTPVTPDKKIQ